jgi:small subunit ribosomal protein S5
MAYEKGNRNSGESNDRGNSEYTEKVVSINRCAKVVKGGRRFSFSALVITGDRQGSIGIGFGKANEVSDAIKKASEASRRRFQKVELKDATIPHEVIGSFGGGKVLLKPASPGTGIIAGGGVRPVCEAAGIKDVIAKNLGSKNASNVVKATIEALLSLRTKEQLLGARGKKVAEKQAL